MGWWLQLSGMILALIGGALTIWGFAISPQETVFKSIFGGNGGAGGSATVNGNGTAIGGRGGAGGPGGKGGDGGDAEVSGDGFAMGGEGGEAGQANRGGKGGRGPLQVLMEDYPEKWREIAKTFGLTEEDARKYGRGGDGANPAL